MDPDPHQSEKVEALKGHFGALEAPNLREKFSGRIRILISLKGGILVRISLKGTVVSGSGSSSEWKVGSGSASKWKKQDPDTHQSDADQQHWFWEVCKTSSE
jgi:hypothetical protein